MTDAPTALIFAPSRTKTARAIASVIGGEPQAGRGRCRVCADAAAVHAVLRRIAHRQCLLVLVAGSHQELDQMLEMSAWFQDFPLILVLPDDRSDTLAKAHRLRPRYLMKDGLDYQELHSVAGKLLRRYCPHPPPKRQRTPSMLVTLAGRVQAYFRIRKTPIMRRRKGINAWDPSSTHLKERKRPCLKT